MSKRHEKGKCKDYVTWYAMLCRVACRELVTPPTFLDPVLQCPRVKL